ncbi:cobalt ABC transporter permease [Fructobacillus pseudoficulneus]|uniref:Cobalt ABC transporter permease n=1 Tax=Fructobacillus pseudoficulneus TaxID=220714 RepID=A0A3F3H390_9LACO|nr:cobalt ABC transporter permease [Fructobacillus pseudoficulneus]SEH38335.1 energy-coupling factor transport system substrate-specific component [Fructobacillus pseudoficulneus]
MKQKWTLQNVILLALIGIIFSVVYWIMDPVYNLVSAGLAAFGLQNFANEITLGVWMMAGPLASYLLKKIGAGFIGEMLGAAGEMFLGGSYGVGTLLSGFIQGIGSELGFALVGYKNWSAGLWLSTLTGTVVTFGWDLIKSGYAHYHFGMLIALFIVRYLSIFFFAGVLVYLITKLLDRSKLLSND